MMTDEASTATSSPSRPAAGISGYERSATSSPVRTDGWWCGPPRPPGPEWKWRCRSMIRVLIVDDHAVVRRGLAQLLDTTDDLRLAGEAADGEIAIAMAAEVRPDVVLMDLSMPNLDGIQAITRILAA